jgi:hypothetical protein
MLAPSPTTAHSNTRHRPLGGQMSALVLTSYTLLKEKWLHD